MPVHRPLNWRQALQWEIDNDGRTLEQLVDAIQTEFPKLATRVRPGSISYLTRGRPRPKDNRPYEPDQELLYMLLAVLGKNLGDIGLTPEDFPMVADALRGHLRASRHADQMASPLANALA